MRALISMFRVRNVHRGCRDGSEGESEPEGEDDIVDTCSMCSYGCMQGPNAKLSWDTVTKDSLEACIAMCESA